MTRTEVRPWESEPYVAHLCDECIDAVVERPLEDVLAAFCK